MKKSRKRLCDLTQRVPKFFNCGMSTKRSISTGSTVDLLLINAVCSIQTAKFLGHEGGKPATADNSLRQIASSCFYSELIVDKIRNNSESKQAGFTILTRYIVSTRFSLHKLFQGLKSDRIN